MASATIHGARRRRCPVCGRTWTIRPRKRGPKRKRVGVALAQQIVRCRTSLRGLAEINQTNRETLRQRFHCSLRLWQKRKPLVVYPSGSLIAIIDALWFSFGKQKKRKYGCFTILLRPVSGKTAMVAVMKLLPGKEGKRNWRRLFQQLPHPTRKRIRALISDGCRGLDNLAKAYGWHFQWCHAHLKRKVFELRGVRSLPGQHIRRRVTKLIYLFLEAADEKTADHCLQELRFLFQLPQCPKSIPDRLKSVLNKSHLFRAYRQVPELNLPVTTNSVEQINSQVRERLSQIRGLRSPQALCSWLKMFHQNTKPIHCRGYQETIKNHRNSVS